MPPAMNVITMNETRLFAKPRFAGFDAARPSAVLPARFRPSIALPPRVQTARRLPTENFLTSADRPIASALPTSSSCQQPNEMRQASGQTSDFRQLLSCQLPTAN